MFKSQFLTLLLIWSPILIFAQVGIESNSSSNTCDCTPACTSLEGDFDCKLGRVVSREDCPCCKVCLRQEGESCAGIDSPCDTKLGLTCSPKGVCQANPKCKTDPDCPSDRFCVHETCTDPCTLLEPCRGVLNGIVCVTIDHLPRCECPQGTIANNETKSCLQIEENSSPSLVSLPSHIGCKVDGNHKSVGESFYSKDCKQKCVCGREGEVTCAPLSCPTGLFPAGSSHDQRFCIEIRNTPLADQCCVVLACSNNLLQSIQSPTSKQESEIHRLESPRALSGRKITEDGGQSISEFDYQQRLEELEALLNGNRPNLKEDDHLLKDKNDLFSRPLSFSENFEVEKEGTTDPIPVEETQADITTVKSSSISEEKEKEKKVLQTTEATISLTTFLLHSSADVATAKPQNMATSETTNTMSATSTSTPLALTNTEPTTPDTSVSPEMSKMENALTDMTSNVTLTSTSIPLTMTNTESTPADTSVSREMSKMDTTLANLTSNATSPSTSIPFTITNTELTTEGTPVSIDISKMEAALANLTSNETLISTSTPIPFTINNTESTTVDTPVSTEMSKMEAAPASMTTNATSTSTSTSTSTLTTSTSTSASSMTSEKKVEMKIETEPDKDTDVEMTPVSETLDPELSTDTPSVKDEVMKEGMIIEIAEDGKPLHNVSLVNEMPPSETFREGKESSEGGFKPTVMVDKDHKTTMMQQEKFSSKPGMLHVKTSTHNSTTLILPSSSGGVLHYKESRSDIEAMKLTVESGQQAVEVGELSPNTRYTFKWAGSGGEPSKGKIEVKTEDGCRHKSVSYPVGAKWHDGCQTSCSCKTGGVSECQARCIFVAGAVKDDQCEETPSPEDPECCVKYNCEKKDNSVLDSPPVMGVQTEPKLIVTSRSHNSVTVAWDDFRADNPDRGYVTEYREVPSVEINTEIPWMKKETLRGQPPPTMTIGSLKPNTLYEVRVGIYSQAEERRLSAATETITVRTEPGCVYGNTSFPVGEFFQGCEERCSCAKDGSVKCAGRCTIPYFRKGSFANDPLCSEEPEDGDECCVVVMCAHGDSRGGGDYDQCANTVCGKNAECVSWPTLTEAAGDQDLPQPGSCRCKEGFSGDATDHVIGCTADLKEDKNSNNCIFRLTSYSPGDVFYDGCSYKCTCNNQREIECQPRCKYSAEETQEETNNSCSYEADPEDECCNIKVCNSTSDADVGAAQSQSLDFDGCTFANKTYAKSEEFTSGCDSKCLCMGFGDISCFPRCPPVKELTHKEGVICETLLDPEDECCNVTVCDDTAPDVMKANVTDIVDMMDESTDSPLLMEMDKDENKTMVLLEEDKMHNNETEMDSMNKTSSDSMNESMSDSMNKTMMEPDDMMPKADNETIIEMNVSESEMKNMTSMEDETDETMLNATTAIELMEEKEFNSTDEDMMSMNNTEPVILFGDDTMHKSDNETHEEHATFIDVDEHMHMTDSNATDGRSFMDNMDKEIMENFDNETEVTTFSTETMVEDIIIDRAGESNETDSLFKKARFDDIMIPPMEIGDIIPMDSSTVKMTVRVTHNILASLLSSEFERLIVSYSHDSLTWTNKTITVNEVDIENMSDVSFMISDLEAHDAYQFKVYYRDMVTPTKKASLATTSNVHDNAAIPHEASCVYKGKHYKAGDNFLIGCEQYCQCTDDLHIHCDKLECPERFGLDLMDPGCLEWEDDPTYVATPPSCCAQIPRCAMHIDQLACTHMGQTFQHLDFISKELVGCDQRCQCISGFLDCESLCGPVSATPPFHLDCREVRLVSVNTYPCCKEWQCSNETDSEVDFGFHPVTFPDNIHFAGQPTPPELELNLEGVTDITENTARIMFSIADIFVGLPGGIYLRYTPDVISNPNPLKWDSEIIHEDGVIMDRKNWEYVKRNMLPGTNYTMQLALFTHLKRAETVSRVFDLTTIMEVTTPLPRLDLDAELSSSEIQNTSAKISWKHFNDHELQYIDGIRVRFWPGNKKFPLEGPMLHREADSMILRDLLPDTKYTVDLFFIPHGGLTSTISNTKNITFMTRPKPKDKYAFNITIEAGEMSQDGVQILYSGVVEPEGKFVNVYRVVYTTDGDSQDSQKFKVPKNQKEGFIMLTDLKPGVQYEVWLEAYLTNGGKKKSNVITIKTKPGDLPIPEKSEIAESTNELKTQEAGSYYSAFVAVVILVVLACLVILGLIFILFRRLNHAKAHINSGKPNSAYDNPSYKTSENQQSYAMEMNGLKNTTNGASRPEEP